MTAIVRSQSFGAELLAPDRTRFRLWAPGCEAAAVEIDGGPPTPMAKAEGGWFEAEVACGAGTRYRYRISPELAVPDPAARAQAGGPHGWSLVVDLGAFPWRRPDWPGRPWHEAVVYEAHVGLLGGFSGVAKRLPALKRLGITAVELMPIAEFPGARNWGYDGVLPYAPDGAYGSPEELMALVDRAHQLGLTMMLDVVYNHFGPDGNYLGAYAPGFFREDRQTPWGGAIDFRRPEVRRFFIDNALQWLVDYRFDGLRLDAVHAIADPTFLEDLAAEVRDAAGPGRHICLVVENEANDAPLLTRGIDAQWNDDFHHAVHVMLTGETHGYYADFAEDPAGKLARALKEGFVYQGQPAPSQGKPRGTPSAGLPTTAFVDCVQNHDQIGNRGLGERLLSLADPEGVKAAVGLLLLTPQIPMIFMGEEVGSRAPFYYFTNHGPELAEAVREGRRREFAHAPEFRDPERPDRLPDPNAPETFEASRPTPGPDAEDWRALYQRLLAFRRDFVTPGVPGAAALEARAIGDKAVFARWRLGDGSGLALAANLGETPAALPDLGDPQLVVGPPPADGALPGRAFAAWCEPAA